MGTGFDIGDLGGFDLTKVHRLEKCWSDKQIEFMKKPQKVPNPAGGEDIQYPVTRTVTVDGKKTQKEVSLYEDRQSIAKCIKSTLKQRKKNKDFAYPTGGECG